MVDRGNTDDTAATRRIEPAAVDDRPRLDLLAWAGWIIGGELIVTGLVALARAGFGQFDLFEPIVAVGPFHLTRLFALICIALGAIVWGGTAGTADQMGLRVVGAAFLVIGIVWMIEPDGFRQWLGTESSDGVHFTIAGLVLIATSMLDPIPLGSRPPGSGV